MNNQTLSTEIPPFEQLVVGGGDDRLDLLTSGKNKYNVDPNDFRGVLNRASCTCSPFTPLGYEAARALYERLSPEVFDEVRGEHTRKIKNLINYASHDRFHVFYAPSGSDLCYYPLMFSRLIHPDKDIFNVITCPEELGSGSLAAYNGKSFFNRNQFGEVIEKGEPLSDDLTIKSETFPARSKDGTIVNHWHKIIDVIHDNYLDYSVNANLVIGSSPGGIRRKEAAQCSASASVGLKRSRRRQSERKASPDRTASGSSVCGMAEHDPGSLQHF